uniref:Ribosomal protein L33 n=1 Tax=Panagrolaimus sp. JU765 TaxID=591449 RepID=A0AC34QFK5_9BILA
MQIKIEKTTIEAVKRSKLNTYYLFPDYKGNKSNLKTRKIINCPSQRKVRFLRTNLNSKAYQESNKPVLSKNLKG